MGSWLPIHFPTSKQPDRHCLSIGSQKHRQKVFKQNILWIHLSLYLQFLKPKKKKNTACMLQIIFKYYKFIMSKCFDYPKNTPTHQALFTTNHAMLSD